MTDGKSLKLLSICSSFGKNTTELLYDVAIAQGYDNVTVARLYASGCTLQEHANNAQNPENKFYQYTRISNIPNDIAYGTKWKLITQSVKDGGVDGASLSEVLAEDWDIILLQQSAAQAPRQDTYEDYIDTIMDYLKEKQPNAKFVWNMLWAYDQKSDKSPFSTIFNRNQMAMYQSNVDATVRKIVPRADIHRIIPTGTVIQNARSYYGDALCQDTFHLNNYGGVLAAYGLYATLIGKELTHSSMNLDSDYWYKATINNGISGAGGRIILTDQDKNIFIEAINNALRDPFHVTKTKYQNNHIKLPLQPPRM